MKEKVKTAFFCQECGASSPKWLGRCPSCNAWNTYVEEVIHKEAAERTERYNFSGSKAPSLMKISEISTSEQSRIDCLDEELNRVLGGGLVVGSVVLLGGEPGIGKSTLMLQLALKMNGMKALYVSGEESGQQIRMRSERLGLTSSSCYVLTETHTQELLQHAEKLSPSIIIIDSIQTLYSSYIDSSAGSISQIRETASELQRYAKTTATPVILIGHITKEGAIAGPKVLEHMVDTVLQFEGDRNHAYRIVRATKNRYGSTSELGIYEMRNDGLIPVSNPSEALIAHREEQVSGTAVSATIEGIRPLLIEVQALVSSAVYGTPQRSSIGFDARRLNMLLAVLEKKCSFRLGAKDVFLNIAGGIRVDDPATDMAVTCAVLSSNLDVALPNNICFAGEVSLSGEIRPVNRIDVRISEAEKLGFEKIYISKYNIKNIPREKFNIEILTAAKIEDIGKILFP